MNNIWPNEVGSLTYSIRQAAIYIKRVAIGSLSIIQVGISGVIEQYAKVAITGWSNLKNLRRVNSFYCGENLQSIG